MNNSGACVRVVAPPLIPRAPRWLSERSFRTMAMAQLALMEEKPSTVHGYIGSYGGRVAVEAKKRWGCKAVVHEMSCPADMYFDPSAGDADWIRVPSEKSRGEIRTRGLESRVVTCVAWSGRERVPPEGKFRPDITRVLYAGLFYRRKGADLIGPAAMYAFQHRAPLEVVCVGDGPLYDSIKAFMSFLQGFWVHHRPQTREPYLQWLDWADLVVCPSREESFGVTAFEAAANGCAVACTRTGAHADLIDMGAAVELSIGCAESLAHVMRNPPPRPSAEMVSEVRARFGWKSVARALLD